jgi:glycosyltransferase involved in cell wall biosynthesis
MPELSVVIPTFRRPGTLREAIESVLAQGIESVEIVVLDDSPEGSAAEAVAAVRDARVTYVKRAVPSGGRPAAVRNEGKARVTGRYVHFLDDDDRVAEGGYHAMLRAFEARLDVGVMLGRVRPFGAEPALLPHERRYFFEGARRSRLAARLGPRLWMAANMLFTNPGLVNSACMIRGECLRLAEDYDASLRTVEDLDFWLRQTRRFGCAFVDDPFIHYRVAASSLMRGGNTPEDVRAAFAAIYESYRAKHGGLEFYALKVWRRALPRWL